MSTKKEAVSKIITIRVNLLGGFSLETNTGKSIIVSSRKACGVIAYLAINKGKPIVREFLTGMFWSDRSETQARASLRQTLKHIRTLLAEIEFKGFSTQHQVVFFEEDCVEVDLFQLREEMSNNLIDEILIEENGVPEKILYGFENLDPSFTAWLHVIRKKWGDYFAETLQTILKTGSASAAKFAADALVNIDPTHEEAQRIIIRHYANAGNVSAAIRQYNILWKLLGDEYDMEPDNNTIMLIADIKSGSYQPEENEIGSQLNIAPTQPIEEQTKQLKFAPPVIGIAKFMQGGEWGLDDFLINGFRSELTASLARFREWAIVEVDPKILTVDGRKRTADSNVFNLDYQLDGTYFEHEGAIRIVITLKETVSQRYIWSEQFDLSDTNWAAMRQLLVRRISMAMNVYLSSERLNQHLTQPGLPVEAHSLWLKGYNDTLFWTPEHQENAENTFREIISIAPTFAPAFSSLASIYNTKHFRYPGLRRSKKSVSEALKFSRISVDLDPLDTRNHLALGWSNAMAGRYDQAELHFSMAHELNPNSPTTLAPCAHGISYSGNRAKARELAEAAAKLNPALSAFQWGYIACIRFFDKDFTSSLEAFDNAQDVITDLVGWRAAAEAMQGKESRARDTGLEFLALVRARWHSDEPANDLNIVSWFLHCFPIRRKADQNLLKEGLRRAGLPVG